MRLKDLVLKLAQIGYGARSFGEAKDIAKDLEENSIDDLLDARLEVDAYKAFFRSKANTSKNGEIDKDSPRVLICLDESTEFIFSVEQANERIQELQRNLSNCEEALRRELAVSKRRGDRIVELETALSDAIDTKNQFANDWAFARNQLALKEQELAEAKHELKQSVGFPPGYVSDLKAQKETLFVWLTHERKMVRDLAEAMIRDGDAGKRVIKALEASDPSLEQFQ